MSERLVAIAMAAALASASGSACAMSPPDRDQRCQVVGGDKLPAEAGGADALCAAIERAAAEQAPGVDFRVVVRVVSPSRLAATLTMADGRVLPEQNYAISDRGLNGSSLQRFANSLAAELAKAARR